MTTREDFRRDGAALRERLFGPGAATHFVPNYADLRAELAFGVVWNRPGLALPDRMIAALAALCSVQRLNHLRRHIVVALDLGLEPRSIVEIFIQCGIYAGLPASEEAMAVAEAVYAERGIELPPEPPRADSIEMLDRRVIGDHAPWSRSPRSPRRPRSSIAVTASRRSTSTRSMPARSRTRLRR